MGYAKLNFATTVTTAQAMYDVVRCLNGNITSTANLSYASTTNSEIVNTLGENWTVVYGSVADTTTAYVVSSPTLMAGQTHYAKLQLTNGSAWDASAAFSTAGAGIGVNTIEAATSATAVTNPAYYSTSTGSTGMGRYVVKVDASNTNIYLHWSQHHILMFGLNGTLNQTSIIGTFEYNYNALNEMVNGPPVLQYNYVRDASTFQTAVVPQTGTSTVNILQGIDVHQPSTSTTSGVYNFGISGIIGTMLFTDSSAVLNTGTNNPVQTLNSSGVYVYPLMPIYFSNPTVGLPIYNISDLSGFYRMATGAAVAESVFTVGADSYVYLPLGTTITGTSATSALGLLKK